MSKKNSWGLDESKYKEKLTPDELIEKMNHCTFEFEQANRKMRHIEDEFKLTRRTKEVGAILAAKRWDLLVTPEARERYQECCSEEKFKPTKDVVEDFTYLELLPIIEPYRFYETMAKQAQKEYEMYQGQLFKYQSELKFQAAEMKSLGYQAG